MFRYLIRPECLFLIGTLQAFIPYVVWHFSDLNPSYRYQVSYIPIVIYSLGYVSFFLGTRTSSTRRVFPRFTCLGSLNTIHLLWARLLVSVIAVIAIIGVIRVYGCVPFLAFLSGKASVLDTDSSIAEGSTLGQMAFLNVTLFLLAACVLLTLLVRLQKGQRSLLSWQLLLPVAILIVGSTMSGKRQSIVLMAVFISTGLIVYSNNAISFLLDGFHIRTFLGRAITYVAALIATLFLFNYVGTLRSERDASLGISEAVSYLEQPQINLEYQCELAGFGPGDFAPAAILATLLPRRCDQYFPDLAIFQYYRPPRLEPTSPTGFYGELHWYIGMPGVLLFPFVTGWACRYCYAKAFHSIFFLFCYCQISWALLSCHSFNLFLHLVFVPLPILAFSLLAYVLRSQKLHALASATFIVNHKSPIRSLQPGDRNPWSSQAPMGGHP